MLGLGKKVYPENANVDVKVYWCIFVCGIATFQWYGSASIYHVHFSSFPQHIRHSDIQQPNLEHVCLAYEPLFYLTKLKLTSCKDKIKYMHILCLPFLATRCFLQLFGFSNLECRILHQKCALHPFAMQRSV